MSAMQTAVSTSSIPAAATGPRYEPEVEVRLAVVMYGGVSLAIYINGVAQELLRMVRATAPSKPSEMPSDEPMLMLVVFVLVFFGIWKVTNLVEELGNWIGKYYQPALSVLRR